MQMRPSITKDPAQHRALARVVKRGSPRSCASRSELFTERNLGLCAQLPMPSGRQLGILRWRHAINHPPAWLTIIFIWDRCRAPSSAMGRDRADVAIDATSPTALTTRAWSRAYLSVL